MFLTPGEPGPDIYLINQTASLPSTSNSTECFANLMSPSSHLSSPVDSSLSHSQCQQVTTMSLFQLQWVYKQASLDPHLSVSPLLLPRQHLLLYKSSPHPCLLLLDVPFPDEKTLFPRFLSCLSSGRKLVRTSPLALFLMLLACLPRGCRSQLRKSTLFLLSSQLHHAPVVQLLALASLNCNLVPQFPQGIGRTCGTVLVPLCGASPCSCELDLAIWCHFIINETFLVLFITVLRSLSFLIPH